MGVNSSVFGRVTGSPVQNWAGKCCLICLHLSLQGIKKLFSAVTEDKYTEIVVVEP